MRVVWGEGRGERNRGSRCVAFHTAVPLNFYFLENESRGLGCIDIFIFGLISFSFNALECLYLSTKDI